VVSNFGVITDHCIWVGETISQDETTFTGLLTYLNSTMKALKCQGSNGLATQMKKTTVAIRLNQSYNESQKRGNNK